MAKMAAEKAATDAKALENVFLNGNPYTEDKVLLIAEISAVGEDNPTLHPMSTKPKVLITKQTFENLVLGKAREYAANAAMVEKIKTDSKEWYSSAARAGYNTPLARAIAYTARMDTALAYYYAANATNNGTNNTNTTGSSSGGGNTINVPINGVNYVFAQSNIPYIYVYLRADGQKLYYNNNISNLIDPKDAKLLGVV